MDYFYNATFLMNVPSIARRGLVPTGRSTFGGGYEWNVKGAVFLTEWEGVEYWMHKMEEMAEYNSDNPVLEGWIPVALRVVDYFEQEPELDEAGTRDSGHDSYKVPFVDPDAIELWDPSAGRWVDLNSADLDKIEDYVIENSEQDIYEEDGEEIVDIMLDSEIMMPTTG